MATEEDRARKKFFGYVMKLHAEKDPVKKRALYPQLAYWEEKWKKLLKEKESAEEDGFA